MRRVDLHVESAVAIRKSGNGSELSNFAARLDPRGMHGVRRIRRKSISTVLDAGAEFVGDVLVERAPQTNVEALAAIANGKHWFPGGQGVLEDSEICFLAMRIGSMGFFVARGTVEHRV